MSTAPAPGGPEYLRPGAILGDRYEIRREVGRGGYSVVYLALDRDLQSDVAVKLLVPPPALARLARERMRREAVAARGLAHPNIVPLHDYLEDGPWSFLVMEYVDGPDLGERIERGGPLSSEESVRLGRDVAAALSVAHKQGILHRDVKPQNVLLDPEGRARLADFGSARLEGQATLTATGGLVGTVAYASPEEMEGVRADARSDVYSLGLTLYFALTGELPDRASPHLPPTPAEAGYRPRARRPEVPLELDEAIACATSRAPSHRFPTAAALGDALLSADEGTSVAGLAESSPPVFPFAAGGDWCPLCGTMDDLGLGVCPACAGGAGTADTLLFIAAPAEAKRRAELQERLTTRLAGAARSAELRDAMAGARPLARLSTDAAQSAVARLAQRSVPVTAEPLRRAWGRIPFALATVLFAVLVAGTLAGLVALPKMLLVAPLFALLLALLAVRRIQTPLLGRRRRSRLSLPPGAEGKVRRTLAGLAPGPARNLLQDLVRMAAGVHEQALAPGGPDVARTVDDLLLFACDVAVDLGHLDESLSILGGQRAPAGSSDPPWLQAVAQANRARDALTQRLLETLAALGRIRTSSASDGSAAAELAAFAQELESDVAAHADARREIEALLG